MNLRPRPTTLICRLAIIIAASTPVSAEAGGRETPATGPTTTAAADDPVVRAAEGNWALAFQFAGLGTMFHNSTGALAPSGFLINQVAIKSVIDEDLMVLAYLGAGMQLLAGPARSTDWGLTFGGGATYHFRIWRRISPFVGGTGGFAFSDPNGNNNFVFAFNLQPVLGVEYYIADRLSLSASYMLALLLAVSEVPGSSAQFLFAVTTAAGGALTVAYYF